MRIFWKQQENSFKFCELIEKILHALFLEFFLCCYGEMVFEDQSFLKRGIYWLSW